MGETTDRHGQRPYKPATSTFTYASAEDEFIACLEEGLEADGLSGGVIGQAAVENTCVHCDGFAFGFLAGRTGLLGFDVVHVATCPVRG